MSYETIEILDENQTKTIINPTDQDFYDKLYLVSLSYVDYGRLVFAECAQDAIDEVFDYELETNGRHFFLDDNDIDDDETDILRAGNYSLALPSQDVNCFEITGERKKAVIEHCQKNGFSFRN